MTMSTEEETPAAASPLGRKYSLRAKSLRKREETELRSVESRAGRTPRAKQRSAPLSKYRRKTANHRERERMKDINQAFELLQRAVPEVLLASTSAEKLTKVMVLRTAIRYIKALAAALETPASPSEESPASPPAVPPAVSPAFSPAVSPAVSATSSQAEPHSVMLKDAALEDPLDSLEGLTDFQLPDGFDSLLGDVDEGISVSCSDFSDFPSP